VQLTGCFLLFPPHKWGFIDKTGKLVIPYQFDDVETDNYGGFEDPNWSYFLPKPFRNFSEGLCAVRIGDKWGYIDKTGAVVITPQFDSAGIFSEGLACVRKGRKVGYIDKTGKLAIPMKFDWFAGVEVKDPPIPDLDFAKSSIQVFQFSEGLASARSGNYGGYIDKSGKFVIPPIWERCSPFTDGKAIVCKGIRLSVIDKSGKATELPPQTCRGGDDVYIQIIGLPPQHKFAYVDQAGKKVIPQEFTDAHEFSEGLAAVAPKAVNDSNQNRGWGYIDRSGKFVIPPSVYISGNNVASAFVNGRAIVSQISEGSLSTRNLHGAIDKTGKWVVQPKYEHISAFREGLARAFRNGDTVYLEKDGNEVINAHTGWGNTFSDGLAAIVQR
jgi:hypothetical protein